MLDERPYHHGNLRAALLQAAADMVAESGLEAASTRALARRVGVAPSAVFRHFKDKRALFTAYAADGFRRLAITVAEARAETGSSPAKQLAAMARAYLTFAFEHPGWFRVMFRADQIDAADPDLAAAREMLYAALRRGALRIGSRDSDVAVLVHATVHGLATLALETELADDLPDDIPGRVGAVMAMVRRLVPLLDQPEAG